MNMKNNIVNKKEHIFEHIRNIIEYYATCLHCLLWNEKKQFLSLERQRYTLHFSHRVFERDRQSSFLHLRGAFRSSQDAK